MSTEINKKFDIKTTELENPDYWEIFRVSDKEVVGFVKSGDINGAAYMAKSFELADSIRTIENEEKRIELLT